MPTPKEVHGLLLADPVAALKRYPLKLSGANRASGPGNFHISTRGDSLRPGAVLGTHRMHSTTAFDIRAVDVLRKSDTFTFNAHLLSMANAFSEAALYPLDGAGPSLMLTGELTGCSIVARADGPGKLRVAHVRPTGKTGQELYAELSKENPDDRVYGAAPERGHYESHRHRVSVVGVRQPGRGWVIYAQKVTREAPNSVLSVWEVFPGRRKV